jgi:hypothetical protein
MASGGLGEAGTCCDGLGRSAHLHVVTTPPPAAITTANRPPTTRGVSGAALIRIRRR